MNSISVCDAMSMIKKKKKTGSDWFSCLRQSQLTFVGHLRTSLQVHLAASFGSDLVDLIAHIVATVLSAAQAEPFLKGFL